MPLIFSDRTKMPLNSGEGIQEQKKIYPFLRPMRTEKRCSAWNTLSERGVDVLGNIEVELVSAQSLCQLLWACSVIVPFFLMILVFTFCRNGMKWTRV